MTKSATERAEAQQWAEYVQYLEAEVERLTVKAENWQRIAAEVTVSEQALRLDNDRLRAIVAGLHEMAQGDD